MEQHSGPGPQGRRFVAGVIHNLRRDRGLTMALTTHPPVPSVTSLSRGDIWIEPEVQQRACLDATTVQEYTALYQEGRDLGPLVVFRDNDVYLLADGFHRYEAACCANVTTLPVVVYHGTLRDALFYATSCNLHGKPLTNADKWRRVLTVLAGLRMGAVVRQCHCEALRRNATLCRHGAEVT